LNKSAWAAFWILGLIWGSSFLLISVGVEDMSATQVVFIRTIIATIGLNIVRHFRGFPIPRDWPMIRAFIFIGVGNATIPYTLISLGEQNISSGMAAVLQSTASLFTLVTAHLAFADERISRQKVIGLLTGFIGVIMLSSETVSNGTVDTKMLLGQLAVIGASFFYAVFTVHSRKVLNQNIQPIVVSSASFIAAAISAFGFVFLEPLLGGRSFVPLTEIGSDVLQAVFMLGFLNTFIAYLFFYFIVRELGALRASMVTYVVPIIGLTLGVLARDEIVTWVMVVGAITIMTGIIIINVKPDMLFNRGKRTEVTSSP
jgi:drug/metabolite transporter (DMT)-like permease